MTRSVAGRVLALTAFLFGALGFITSSYGHALQPGYLELRLIDHETYAVVWKTPAIGARPMAITARLPESCDPRTPVPPIWDGAAYVARWTASCAGGLEGGVIHIDGLDQTSTDVLVRFDFANGISEARRLTPGDPSFIVPTQPSRFEVVRTYFLLGVEHILLGIDHLLFVLALMLLVKGMGRIIVTVTAFTLAHSLTLAGATLGFVHMPGATHRGGHRVEHRVRRIRNHPQPAGKAGADGTVSMGGRFHLRPAAWLWLRWGVGRSRSAAKVDPHRAAVL